MSLTEEHSSDVENELDSEDGEKEKAVSIFWALKMHPRCGSRDLICIKNYLKNIIRNSTVSTSQVKDGKRLFTSR